MAAPKYIYGDTRPRKVKIATAQAAAIGDAIAMISNTALPAASVTWNSTTAATQADMVAGFVGVSVQAKTADVARIFGNSEDNVLMVAAGGIWEFDCASATFEFGALVGMAKQSGNFLESQKVVSVATEELAIGRVAERGTSITRVRVELLSKLNPAARQQS